jgi:hypothetical protein
MCGEQDPIVLIGPQRREPAAEQTAKRWPQGEAMGAEIELLAGARRMSAAIARPGDGDTSRATLRPRRNSSSAASLANATPIHSTPSI